MLYAIIFIVGFLVVYMSYIKYLNYKKYEFEKKLDIENHKTYLDTINKELEVIRELLKK